MQTGGLPDVKGAPGKQPVSEGPSEVPGNGTDPGRKEDPHVPRIRQPEPAALG